MNRSPNQACQIVSEILVQSELLKSISNSRNDSRGEPERLETARASSSKLDDVIWVPTLKQVIMAKANKFTENSNKFRRYKDPGEEDFQAYLKFKETEATEDETIDRTVELFYDLKKQSSSMAEQDIENLEPETDLTAEDLEDYRNNVFQAKLLLQFMLYGESKNQEDIERFEKQRRCINSTFSGAPSNIL